MDRLSAGKLSEEERVEEEGVAEAVTATIVVKINQPPPKDEKYWKIKMALDQQFGSIMGPLEGKCKRKIVSFSFDGEQIANECTPQKLIDEFDLEAEDIIDARYS